jgi:signal peptidase I
MAAADETERKSTIREYYEALLIALIFVNFARIFVFQAFKIPTGSMEDNLKVGDHLIVNKFVYGPPGPLARLVPIRDVHRGDIIVFRFPRQPETDFVKRVVGLPGETILIRRKRVYVDGRALDEPYVVHDDPQIYPGGEMQPEPYRSRDNFGPYHVPDGEYFAMGDNRDRSHDSRYWGGVPRSMIKGRAFMVYWSFEADREAPPPGSPLSERVSELWGVARGFKGKTRWNRTFFIVDSKYHYTPGVSSYGNE